MYAVIRAGGRQFRVAPGDVIKISSSAAHSQSGHSQSKGKGKFEFAGGDVLAVSAEAGKLATNGNAATVSAQVVDEGLGKKVLVFHYKRKKQYKKLQGHRQAFTALRITEIAFDGQKFSAPELPAKKVKAKPEQAEADEGAREGETKHAKAGAKAASSSKAKGKAKKAAPKKSAAKKSSKKSKK